MSTMTRPGSPSAGTSGIAGTTALVLGALFLVSTAFTCVLSVTSLIDPPNWVRALALAGLPLGFFGTPIAYVVARRGRGRLRARIGLGLALVALVGFVVLLVALGE